MRCTTIGTLDHQRRVFVSSSARELAPERAAARQAIEALNMTAVMPETGTGSDSPGSEHGVELRRSDVFVGLYWQRYGRVAPDEDISRLEDEYRRSAGMPRLLYVKEPAFRREPRLAGLLRRIQADDTASYKPFADAAELNRLLTDDLARLIALG
jgi:Domain of unknown function (DUF4062)